MNLDYYKQEQIIAQVDEKDRIIGKIEKWEAHTKGILHRAFTIAVFCENHVILQHRKHPSFDGYFDMTLSSHQIYNNDVLEDDITAIYKCLKRELHIDSDFVTEPVKRGTVIYDAHDPAGKFIEHELCYFYTCEINKIPPPEYEFAYGYLVVPFEELKSGRNHVSHALAPWVKEFFKQGII